MLGRTERLWTVLPASIKPRSCVWLERHESQLTALTGERDPSGLWTRCPTTTCTSVSWRRSFPGAAFIHCRRDLRDVAVSCWMTDFRSIRWANDMEHIATRFQQYRRLMEHWNKVLPAPMHEVDYEETVADLERWRGDWSPGAVSPGNPPACEFHETQRPIRTASVTQVRQPIYGTSVARWRNYETALADVLAALPP